MNTCSFFTNGAIWLRLVFATGLLSLSPRAAHAQRHLLLWDSAAANNRRFDLPMSFSLDERQPLRQVLLDPTLIYNEALTRGGRDVGEVVVTQFALGSDITSFFRRTDSLRRYQQLLRPGALHGTLSLLLAHHIDHHFRIWGLGSAALRLYRYHPRRQGESYWLWQRNFGLGFGLAFRKHHSSYDRLAVGVQWGRASHDVSRQTQENFQKHFGPDRSAAFVELSGQVRLYSWNKNGGVMGTWGWKKFYDDYDHPTLTTAGLALTLPVSTTWGSSKNKSESRLLRKATRLLDKAEQKINQSARYVKQAEQSSRDSVKSGNSNR